MSPARPRRARRPSPLENSGNPAAAAPEDDDTTPAAAAETPARQTNGSAEPVAEPAAPSETAQDSEDAPASAKARTRGTGRSAANSGRRTTATRSASRAAASPAATTPAASNGDASPAARDVATGAGRPGRPRVPKPGPVTRVTVDIAQTEQRELERLAGTIGRKIGRDSGKQRLYVQHLMRVATRRLISDSTFRDTIADDLADYRDELKRQK